MTNPFFTDTPVCPPIDPDTAEVLVTMGTLVPKLSDETLGAIRAFGDSLPKPDLTAGGAVTVSERRIPGPDGAPELEITILSPAAATNPLPVIYNIHGGGLVMGNRYMYLEQFVLPYAAEGLAVVVSVGYRFAPEHQAPAQVEDCYAGLVWVAKNAAELGIDPERIVIAGISAGGGLALGISLMARDRGFPSITHQVLIAPMVDERFDHPSTRMVEGVPSDRDDMLYSWRAALGDRHGTEDVSPYIAPARADDLSNLPRTYIDCGNAEGFRDPVLELAMRISQAGGLIDLHMWAGGFHGFDLNAPTAAVSKAAVATRDEYFRRALTA